MEALELGVTLRSPGYNVFVSGLSGTGRLTTIKRLLERLNLKNTTLHDYAYVNNFANPDAPRLLVFERGAGVEFKRSMKRAIDRLKQAIPQMFESENFQAGRKKIITSFQAKQKELLKTFDTKIRPEGFAVGQVQLGAMIQPDIMPLIDNKPITIDEIDELVSQGKMTIDQAKALGDTYIILREEFSEISKQGMRLLQEMEGEIEVYERVVAKLLVHPIFDIVRALSTQDAVKHYLREVEDYVITHLKVFLVSQKKETPEEEADDRRSHENDLRLFEVNLILDNALTSSAPVIIETQPTFVNVFGTIEKTSDLRYPVPSDFTKIKAGSLLRADGGYLILMATDALVEAGVWKVLKRVLLYGRLEIQPIDSYFQIVQSVLKPEAILTDVKVIIIGDEEIYQLLYRNDEDFCKTFKINAEFGSDMPRTPRGALEYARFIRSLSLYEHTLPFTPSGVAAVVEFGSRRAAHQKKLTTRFSDVADVIRESSHLAHAAKARRVERKHVAEALRAEFRRNALSNDRVQELMMEGVLLIDTDGKRVGQVNGLAVYELGHMSFGKPARITASVGVGEAGIISIERESKMSGQVSMIKAFSFSGYFRQTFAQNVPVSISASICFEQSYGGIDGDSASSTELYALLSAIANVPLSQSIAVTGSVNQWGDIQPIGGVNVKIEGFFDLCNARGLSGKQGVMIPAQNVRDLMLREEVIEAVKKKRFHIYPVKRIEEGIEILTGLPAGKRGKNGTFPDGTLFALVEERLEGLYEKLRMKKKQLM